MRRILIFLAISCALPPVQGATRVKELVLLEGVRENPLYGYGLVVGLNGTGDRRQTLFSAQSLTNLLQRMGVTVSASAISVRNTAAVMVAATLPAYAQGGTHLDATVSSVGDATSLQGGLLVLTSLRGADGQVYAIAQGSVVIGGYILGPAGNSKAVNHPTAGRVPEGVIIERSAPTPALGASVKLQLRQADFTTAANIAAAVNRHFSGGEATVARAENSAVVTVELPGPFKARQAEFVAELENLTVETDALAQVVINERTGTIVMGRQLRLRPVAIMHGNLSIELQTSIAVSQPNPLGPGNTLAVPQVKTTVGEEQARHIMLQEGATVEDLVRALNAIGSTPRDIIAILQSLRAAHALEAIIEVI